MPMLSPPVLAFGAKIMSARLARRLREPPAGEQARTLSLLLQALGRTEFGRKHGLHPALNYSQFRQAAPVRTHEQLSPWIGRMKSGASDVLWPGVCASYTLTPGTTSGDPKDVPLTAALVAHFRKCGLEALLAYGARRGSMAVFRGRHLLLGGSTPLTRRSADDPAQSGGLGRLLSPHLPPWVERHYYEPGREIDEIGDWDEKLKALVDRARTRDIRLIAGQPPWLLQLAGLLGGSSAQAGKKEGVLRAVWPRLECVVHGGVPLDPYRESLRSACGPGVEFHEVYLAAECFVAFQDAEPEQGLRVHTHAGVFYEFVPLADFDEQRLEHAASKAVPIEGVTAGMDYVPLITTPGGLCRYVLGDIVRFVSAAPPRLVYVGRTRDVLNAFGEHVLEKELSNALLAVCRDHGWATVQFHVSPQFSDSLTGQRRGRHEWWIELKPGSVETPTGPVLAPELDRELSRQSPRYATLRKTGAIEPPLVRLVMPGVFESWMRQNGRWGGQHKVPHSRSDRQIAEALGKITRFADA